MTSEQKRSIGTWGTIVGIATACAGAILAIAQIKSEASSNVERIMDTRRVIAQNTAYCRADRKELRERIEANQRCIIANQTIIQSAQGINQDVLRALTEVRQELREIRGAQ